MTVEPAPSLSPPSQVPPVVPTPGPAQRLTQEPTPGPANVRPRYGEASLADVMPSVLAVLGVPGASDTLDLRAAGLAGVRTVVVLLLDGFGYHQLALAAPHTPTIADIVRSDGAAAGTAVRAITTVFPSTTPTSLASLGTGAPPGAHGVMGFFVNIPGTDLVLNHVQWRDDPNPLRWQPLPTQFDRARAAGVESYEVSQPEFASSGLTVAAFRGAEYVGGTGPDGVADGVLNLVARATGPTIVFGYLADVDKAGHIWGLDSPQWRMAVAGADRLVTRLVEALPADAALVVTADHGQIDVPVDGRFDLADHPSLRAGVRVVAGEPRVRYLHTLDGARDDVLATWRGVLGETAWVVSREEAAADGWFGPIPEAHLRRVGDVVVVCHENHLVLASGIDPDQVAKNIAFHGSATAPEMTVPLLIVRAA